MLPHQERVIDEKKELDVRLTALSAFIDCRESGTFLQLPVLERQRMREQAFHMRNYSNVLGRRIDAFTP